MIQIELDRRSGDGAGVGSRLQRVGYEMNAAVQPAAGLAVDIQRKVSASATGFDLISPPRGCCFGSSLGDVHWLSGYVGRVDPAKCRKRIPRGPENRKGVVSGVEGLASLPLETPRLEPIARDLISDGLCYWKGLPMTAAPYADRTR